MQNKKVTNSGKGSYRLTFSQSLSLGIERTNLGKWFNL